MEGERGTIWSATAVSTPPTGTTGTWGETGGAEGHNGKRHQSEVEQMQSLQKKWWPRLFILGAGMEMMSAICTQDTSAFSGYEWKVPLNLRKETSTSSTCLCRICKWNQRVNNLKDKYFKCWSYKDWFKGNLYLKKQNRMSRNKKTLL